MYFVPQLYQNHGDRNKNNHLQIVVKKIHLSQIYLNYRFGVYKLAQSQIRTIQTSKSIFVTFHYDAPFVHLNNSLQNNLKIENVIRWDGKLYENAYHMQTSSSFRYIIRVHLIPAI